MGKHEARGKSSEWYTPAYIFQALGERFDLDVAAPRAGAPFVPADHWLYENSLDAEWFGFVWMNPPYGLQKDKRLWLDKFFDHGNGIALMPDRTSAPWWQEAAKRCDMMLFVSPKIQFYRPDGTKGDEPGNGTTLFAAGERAMSALMRARDLGVVSVVTSQKRAPHSATWNAALQTAIDVLRNSPNCTRLGVRKKIAGLKVEGARDA